MALSYDFLSCLPSGACKDGVWRFRYNTTLKDEGLEFWYEDRSDFSRSDTAPSIETEANEIVNDGDPRGKQTITSFTESQDFTINEDCNSAFLQRTHEIWVNATDQQRKAFLNCGLDVEKITYKGDGSYTKEYWPATSFTAFEPPFRKQIPEDEPATFEFSLLFQNEPENINVGFIADLPSTVTAPTATTSIIGTPPLSFSVDLTDIEDPDGLIFNDEYTVFVYDEMGQLVQNNTYNSGDFPVNEIVTQAGDYVITLAYKLFDDGTDVKYQNLHVEELTIYDVPVITVITDPAPFTTAQNGIATYGTLVTVAGIDAIDPIDGDITNDIVFNGSFGASDLLDLSTTGTFPVTLDVTNSVGLAAVQISVDLLVT